MKSFINTCAYRHVITFTACILMNCSAIAQPLTLYDAVQKAAVNYPLINQRQSEVAASRAHVTTINSNRLPSLRLLDEATAGTANSLPGAYFPLSIIPSVSGSINARNNSAAASGNTAISYLDLPVYNFGYYNAATREAKAQLATTQAVLNSEQYSLTENVISLYLDWIKKYRLLNIQAENLQRSNTVLTAIRATVLNGLKPGVDSSTARADYARDRLSYLDALDQYMYDRFSMAAYTGLDTAQVLPDTVAFNHIQAAALPSATTDSVPVNHPLLDVYQKAYEQQLAGNNTISRMYMPRLSVEGAGWMRGSGISPTDNYSGNISDVLAYNRYNYLAAVTLSYNLFDLKHRHDQLTEGRYQARAKQQALQTQQLFLNRSLQQVNFAYTTALQKLTSIPDEVQSAQQAYIQQSALYKAGLNTLIDLTNAQYVLLQTETDFVLAQDELLQLLYTRAGLSNQLDNFLQTQNH